MLIQNAQGPAFRRSLRVAFLSIYSSIASLLFLEYNKINISALWTYFLEEVGA